MTMHILFNPDHGYNVYIGSDEPFYVDEKNSVRPNRASGEVLVELFF
jgi:hypothetical protein